MNALLAAHVFLLAALAAFLADLRLAPKVAGWVVTALVRRGLQPSMGALTHFIVCSMLWAGGGAVLMIALGVPAVPLIVLSSCTAAIALSFQGILSSITAGIYLLAEGHFKVGDTITVNGNPDESGVFVAATLRTIRLQRSNGDTVDVPNSAAIVDLLTIHHPSSKETEACPPSIPPSPSTPGPSSP